MLALQRTAGNAATTRALSARASSGASSAGSAVAVQRYVEIEPGAANYPKKQKSRTVGSSKDADDDPEFFPSQHRVNGSYFASTDVPRAPHIRYNAGVRLRLSDDFELAIEAGSGEAKVFFATEPRIAESNGALAGRVKLHKGKRFLRVRGEQGEKKLFQIEPVVEHTSAELAEAGVKAGSGGLGGKKHKVTGLSVLTPQRCNEMAEFVSGQRGVSYAGTSSWDTFAAMVLDLVHESGSRHLDEVRAAAHGASAPGGSVETYLACTQRMSREFQDLKNAGSPALEQALRKLGLSEFLPSPAVGNVLGTIGVGDAEQERTRGVGDLLYHFGAVVARSGGDYITMENYARNDPAVGTETASRGDPLFFFRMYGTRQNADTWHSHQTSTSPFVGATISVTLEG
ncbi:MULTISPECIES: hypothetical protein [unclassified Streptomyces]|uniref:hypothetical protein n=1 Tax=unclassified Streptomyces TaxID=2593676 RepID=UPI000F6E8D56|nr:MULTISPECIES: hypothetical protein [unclassified Streptomyces]AZM59421.1 hypothetical protein DLM49_07475 [Streptomyces sp. WAC 01438]RSM94072.1 hypothetical protein DMA10_19165 [Streptomyces sp. WAC 01420]